MKCSLTLSFLFVLSLSAVAQPSFTLGLMGGANSSRMYETSNPSSSGPGNDFNRQAEWLAGLQAGLAGSYCFSPYFALAANALYVQKGYRIDNPAVPGTKSSIRLDYLSFPLLARYYPGERFYLETGMEISALLEATSRSVEESIDLNELFGFRGGDFGLAVGLGVTLTHSLHLQARYVHGLTNVLGEIQFTDENGQPLDIPSPRLQNRSLQLSLVMDLLEW